MDLDATGRRGALFINNKNNKDKGAPWPLRVSDIPCRRRPARAS